MRVENFLSSIIITVPFQGRIDGNVSRQGIKHMYDIDYVMFVGMSSCIVGDVS